MNSPSVYRNSTKSSPVKTVIVAFSLGGSAICPVNTSLLPLLPDTVECRPEIEKPKSDAVKKKRNDYNNATAVPMIVSRALCNLPRRIRNVGMQFHFIPRSHDVMFQEKRSLILLKLVSQKKYGRGNLSFFSQMTHAIFRLCVQIP